MPALGAASPTELHIPQATAITMKPVLRLITWPFYDRAQACQPTGWKACPKHMSKWLANFGAFGFPEDNKNAPALSMPTGRETPQNR